MGHLLLFVQLETVEWEKSYGYNFLSTGKGCNEVCVFFELCSLVGRPPTCVESIVVFFLSLVVFYCTGSQLAVAVHRPHCLRPKHEGSSSGDSVPVSHHHR